MPSKTEYMEGMTVGEETKLGEMSRARECGHVGHVTPFLLYPARYPKQGVDGIRLALWKDHTHIVGDRRAEKQEGNQVEGIAATKAGASGSCKVSGKEYRWSGIFSRQGPVAEGWDVTGLGGQGGGVILLPSGTICP